MTVPTIAIGEPSGPDGAPLVVLGPSLATSSAILWGETSALLRRRFRIATWDLPGHGHSPAAVEHFTVAELAQAVLAAVPDERFSYAGVSLGGAVGLEMLLAAPERIVRAAAVCTGAVLGTPESWTARAATVRAQGTAALVVASAQRWFAPGSIERHPEVTGRLLHALRDADDESYALCCEALAGYDVRGALPRIGTPVLALWGRHDGVAPEASAAEIADGVQRGRVGVVEDAAHLAPAEQPEAVASAIIDFFASSTS